MKNLLFALVAFALIGCGNQSDQESSIRKILNDQKAAWNRGDIPSFMSYYLADESLTFAGSSGLTRGHDRVRSSYLKRYDTREKMGELEFEVLEFKSLSDHSALVVGRWSLERAEDNPSGYFSLVWMYTNDGWKIVHDHTS